MSNIELNSCSPMTSLSSLLFKFNQFSWQKATENPLGTLVSVGHSFEKHHWRLSNDRSLFLCSNSISSVLYRWSLLATIFLAEIFKNLFMNTLDQVAFNLMYGGYFIEENS